jgi:expansin (peptidoglycan-binding protein)
VTLGPVTNGIATFYDADGTGNCGFAPSPNDLMVVAPNKDRYYDGSAICGACMRVTGPKGTVTVRVTDSCPDDGDGDCGTTGADLDLSAQAFAAIDDPDRGVSHVSFQLVPCDVTGPMRFHFKSGSSRSWTAIQVLNHRVPIAKLEFAGSDGNFTEMAREDDDYFIAASGVGRTPNGLRLRITSSTGVALEDTLPGVQAGATVDGTQQFP